MEYTNEYIKEIFETSNSQREVIQKLGKKRNGSSWRLINKLAKQIGLDLKEYGANLTHMTKEKYALNPKHCKCCGKELTYEQRRGDFCSHSCSAIINNKERVYEEDRSIEIRRKISEALQRRNPNHKGEIVYTPKKRENFCLNCGKELNNKQKYNKYCCHKCSVEYNYKEKVKRIENGESFTRCGGQVPNFLKRYLMELHNNKCEKCGWGEEHPITHNIPLEVHHIDGDCTNNKLENLQLLCPNCHCLTENFGSLNKNSKRFHRSKIKLIE